MLDPKEILSTIDAISKVQDKQEGELLMYLKAIESLLSEEEKELVSLYRQLTPISQKMVILNIKRFLS